MPILSPHDREHRGRVANKLAKVAQFVSGRAEDRRVTLVPAMVMYIRFWQVLCFMHERLRILKCVRREKKLSLSCHP